MAMRMLITAALAVVLNGAAGLVAGAGLVPATVAGGADCDEKKTSVDCGDATGRVCTLVYPTYAKPPEGVKADAIQLADSYAPCSGSSNCLKSNMNVKKYDENCTPVFLR